MTEPTQDPAVPDVRTHPAVQRVVAALADHLVGTTVVVLEGAARTAPQAAGQLGVGVGQIVNSLVFALHVRADDEAVPLLVLTSGAHRVDTAKVAGLLDADRADRADPEFVRAATGFAIGGVAPLAHPRHIRTLVDVSLARYDTIWAAAGHPHAVFSTTYDELVRVTGGQPIEVV